MIECLSTDILLRDANERMNERTNKRTNEGTNERTKAQEDEENQIAIAHPKNGWLVSQ
jgi:hypothetical protein